jgi:hypothetical protein
VHTDVPGLHADPVVGGPALARDSPAFNLVVVGDAGRLARAGPLPPLRIIHCSVEPGRAVPAPAPSRSSVRASSRQARIKAEAGLSASRPDLVDPA